MNKEEEIRFILNKLIYTDYERLTQKPPYLRKPEYHKAKISIWADLKHEQVLAINDATTSEELHSLLSTFFDLEDYKENKRSSILIEFYTYLIQFAKENCFNIEQTSAFFSIFKQTNDICIETPFMNFEHCFDFFKEMVICHTVRRPPFSIDLFSMHDAKKIMEYGINSYFRHFKLYKYVFTPKVTLNLKMVYDGMPLSPPPEIMLGEVVCLGEELKEQQSDENTEQNNERGEYSKNGVSFELKELIRNHLTAELNQLKMNFDKQLQQTEDELVKRLDIKGNVSPTKLEKPKSKEKKQK